MMIATLSDPIPPARVPYTDHDVWAAEGSPGPVLHGYRDVQHHERWRASQGLGPGLYRRFLNADPGPCEVSVCSRDGRRHYCGEYGDLDQ